MADGQDTLKIWLEAAIRASGLKPTPFAQRAGIAPSTILRALSSGPAALEMRTIQKICDTYRIAPPGLASAAPGLAEPDLLPYVPGDATAELPPNQYQRRAGNRALEIAGILPGDVLTFDMARQPLPGDIVEAQVYALDRPAAETVLRLYTPPLLVPRAFDPAVTQKPLLVDGTTVRIAAVLIRLERDFHRRSA